MSGDGVLSVRCPACGAASDRVPAALAGKTVRCPRCAQRFAVPAAAPPPTEAPPAPTVAEGALAPTRPGAPSPSAPASPGIAWQPGDLVLGLYEVVGVLGQGGMGRVYRVRHRGWGLDLAVKVPLPSVLEAAGGADLFEREAETWVSLGLHPHVVTCHYVRRVDGLPLVFAECVDGGTLHEAIRERRLDSAAAILDVAIQLAWGLDHAHAQGLVHRDVKPANVLLGADGLAKVTDFGLARARGLRLAAPAGEGSGHTMTAEGGGGGTPAYLSPEQAAGRALSRRSDLWSFGLAVLEAFLGGRTWEYGLAAAEALEAYRRDGLAAGGRPAMPETVADLLERCFRERPEARPHDLAGVAATLRDAWEAETGRPYARPEPRGGAGSPDALNNRALSLVDLGRAHEAAALWERALAAEAQHVEATFNASIAAWRAGRLADPELLRRLEESARSHPGRARAQQLLGRAHVALGQHAEALVAFERARLLGGAEDLERDVAAARTGGPPPLRTLRGLSAPVAALALSPDGRTVVAAALREVRAWSVADGRLLRAVAVADGPVRALALLPDARTLLVSAEGAPIAVFDLETGQPVRSWSRHPGFSTSLAMADGGRLVVSGGSDRIVRVWHAGGELLHALAGHEDAVTAVAAGRTVAVSASRDGTVRTWSLDGAALATLRGHEGRVLAVALDEERSRVVSAGEDGTVREWGLRSHALVHAVRSHGQPVNAVALSPDGARIVSGSSDRTVRAFETEGGPIVALLRLDAAITALALSPDGAVWAGHGTAASLLPAGPLRVPAPALCRPSSASEETDRASAFEAGLADARRSLREGDLATALTLVRQARSVPGRERADEALAVWDGLVARLPRRTLLGAWESGRLGSRPDAVLAVAVDPTGARGLCAGLDGVVRVFDLAARREEGALAGHEGAVTSAAFAGSSRALSGGRDRTVRLWELDGKGGSAVLVTHADVVAAVDATPDGVRGACASWDGTVRILDLRRRETAHVLEGHAAHVSCVRFAPGAQVLVSGGWDGTARLWDAGSGASLGVLDAEGENVTSLAVHGERVAAGTESGAVRLWDARSRRLERRIDVHQAEVTGLAFTPDGRFLLSSGRDHSVRVVDLRSGETVRALAHPALVLGLALTPVGSLLLTAGGDGTPRLWHLDWEPDTAPPPPLPAAGPRTVRAGPSAGPAVAPAVAPPTRLPTPTRVLPPLPRTARRLPVGRLALAALLVAATALAWLAWRRPDAGVRLSPTMREGVPREIDLVDLEPFQGDCAPADDERHLDAFRAGRPSARDIACVAARGGPGVVADVLDGAPLDGEEPLEAHRLLRNAASALAGLGEDAVPELCARLEDERAEAREAAALALGVRKGSAADECLREVLSGGSPSGQAAAGRALRQRIARGRFPADEGFALVRQLLVATSPEARIAGLNLAPLFAAEISEPAVRPLEADPEAEVREAAARALAAIDGARRADLLRGGSR
jgi:WD40 repeat protein